MDPKRRVRRAAGTRTMLDVLRNLYRPPTAAQKHADVEYVASGGELKVAARLVSAEKSSPVHWIPQGHLHVSKDAMTWKGSHHPDLFFAKGEWIARPPPSDGRRTQWSLISVVNNGDRIVHHEIRIPTPDVDLIVAAFS